MKIFLKIFFSIKAENTGELNKAEMEYISKFVGE